MAEEKKYGVKEPNEGVNGAMASNMTGEAITGVYDYGNISDSDKRVVREIIDLMRNRGQVPCSMFAEELKTRYKGVDTVLRNGNEYYFCEIVTEAEFTDIK